MYHPARGRESFSRARVLIGPHGAAFANVMFTDGAPMVLLPLCDALGCPAAQDVYFTYIAGALGVEMIFPPKGPRGESIYRNYTVEQGTDQVGELVAIVRRLLS